MSKKVTFSRKVKTITVPRTSPDELDKLYYQPREIQQFRIERRRSKGAANIVNDLVEDYVDWFSCPSWNEWTTSKYIIPAVF
mmetsp:Transcript_10667/g.15695  ORF Transcript_10667/g.15695 Transcript_10667/m.15695 type:complete len:82 (+) Transcript_10667:78-323(+)